MNKNTARRIALDREANPDNYQHKPKRRVGRKGKVACLTYGGRSLSVAQFSVYRYVKQGARKLSPKKSRGGGIGRRDRLKIY